MITKGTEVKQTQLKYKKYTDRKGLFFDLFLFFHMPVQLQLVTPFQTCHTEACLLCLWLLSRCTPGSNKQRQHNYSDLRGDPRDSGGPRQENSMGLRKSPSPNMIKFITIILA